MAVLIGKVACVHVWLNRVVEHNPWTYSHAGKLHECAGVYKAEGFGGFAPHLMELAQHLHLPTALGEMPA